MAGKAKEGQGEGKSPLSLLPMVTMTDRHRAMYRDRPAFRKARRTIWHLLLFLGSLTIFALGFQSLQRSIQRSSGIPNIIHYVHLGQENDTLRFQFSEVLSIYSAHYRLKPDKIFIHTNLNPAIASRDQYTRAIRSLSNVRFSTVQLRHQSSSGVKFTGGFAHESDFVRTAALKEHGGIYMDTDIFVLRDLKSLRNAGFKMVLGRQHEGDVGCALIMTSKDSTLLAAYSRLQDEVYDGDWQRHAIDLLERLTQIHAAVPQQLLVLEQNAFHPYSWMAPGLAEMFNPALGPAEGISPSQDVDATQLTQYERHDDGTFKWDRDYTGLSYTYHGFFTGLARISLDDRKRWFGESADVNPKYILRGKSHFARAIKPVLLRLINERVLHF